MYIQLRSLRQFIQRQNLDRTQPLLRMPLLQHISDGLIRHLLFLIRSNLLHQSAVLREIVSVSKSLLSVLDRGHVADDVPSHQ